jgi:hypothetical protein
MRQEPMRLVPVQVRLKELRHDLSRVTWYVCHTHDGRLQGAVFVRGLRRAIQQWIFNRRKESQNQFRRQREIARSQARQPRRRPWFLPDEVISHDLSWRKCRLGEENFPAASLSSSPVEFAFGGHL